MRAGGEIGEKFLLVKISRYTGIIVCYYRYKLEATRYLTGLASIMSLVRLEGVEAHSSQFLPH